MNDPTLDAINATREDVRALRGDLSAMVTRREHEAEVRRLDAATETLRRDLSDHERDADARHQALADDVKTADALVLAELRADREQRAKEAKALVDQRRVDRRWVVGTIIGGIGVAVALTQAGLAFFA